MKSKDQTYIHLDDESLNIFTDGSSYSHPRMGGLGFRFVTVDADGQEVTFDYSPVGYRGATNQEMELLACIEALNTIDSRGFPINVAPLKKVVVYTDSMYVVENVNLALFEWPKTRWLKRDGNPVIHAELWKELNKRIKFVWHKGHSSKNPHNNAVDKLAKASAKNASNPPLSIVNVRKKLTTKSTKTGSIRTLGQRLTIRIITDRYLHVQKMYVYKYEVISKSSPFYGNVDTIHSTIMLSAGHAYFVKLSDSDRIPRIEKVYRETR